MPAYADAHGRDSREKCQLSSPVTASIGDPCDRFRDQTLPSGILTVYKKGMEQVLTRSFLTTLPAIQQDDITGVGAEWGNLHSCPDSRL